MTIEQEWLRQLLQHGSKEELVAAAMQFLDCSVGGDDITPIITAQTVLQRVRELAEERATGQFWAKEFPLTSLTRADLLSAGFFEAQVSQLSDEDMQAIASKMEDIYCDHGFWEDAGTAYEYVMQRKPQKE